MYRPVINFKGLKVASLTSQETKQLWLLLSSAKRQTPLTACREKWNLLNTHPSGKRKFSNNVNQTYVNRRFILRPFSPTIFRTKTELYHSICPPFRTALSQPNWNDRQRNSSIKVCVPRAREPFFCPLLAQLALLQPKRWVLACAKSQSISAANQFRKFFSSSSSSQNGNRFGCVDRGA